LCPNIKIALLSPNESAYSETFIQAHKNRLKGEIKYYSGGYLPNHLESKGSILNGGHLLKRIFVKTSFLIRKKLGLITFSIQEEALAKSFRREKIQVVFAEYGLTGCEVLPICKKLRLPLIIHFHGFDASVKSVLDEYKDRYRSMFEYASYIIVVSRPMANALIALGAPENKLVYNPCGPNNSFLEVSPDYSEKAFISVGRFVDKKAPYFSLLAFSKVLPKHPNAILYMAGDGPLLNTCMNLAKYLQIESNVKFLGVITPEQYREELSSVLAFVQHSITAENGDTEGNPVGIMEAQAAGVPVISTLHAGIPEVVIHGESGWLVEEGDVEGMAQSMLSLLSDSLLAEKFGKRGREIILEKFLMERHIETLNECIQASIKNQRPPK
jgi:colanic acid/amylovoran biosynthesis glycosyltransferase